MTRVLVLGPALGGKTTLVEYLWGVPFSANYDPDSAHDHNVMGSFQAYPGRHAVKYYLNLHEVHADDMFVPLSRYAQAKDYDVVVIIYDGNDLESVQEVWRALKRGLKVILREASSDAPLPIVLFANKADQSKPSHPDLQHAEREVAAICDEYLIPQPRSISLRDLDHRSLLSLWRLLAGGPREIRDSPARQFLRRWHQLLPGWLWWGTIAAFGLLGVYATLQFFRIPVLPYFRIQSGTQISTQIGDPELYDVYSAHDVEPAIYNLFPEEQERLADAAAAGLIHQRRPVEPIPWQFPHSEGYQPPSEAPTQGPFPYKQYQQPGKYSV